MESFLRLPYLVWLARSETFADKEGLDDMMLRTIAFLGALLAAFGAAAADEPLSPEQAFRVEVSRGSPGGLRFTWDIAAGYYLYRERIEASSPGTGKAIPLRTEDGVRKDDVNFGDTEVYFGHAAAAADEPGNSPFELTYQGCKDESICYPPVTVTVDPATASIVQGSNEAAAARADRGQFKLAGDAGLVDSLLSDGGRTWAIASFFVFGLLLAFTPCVFPMYPILAGILAREGGSLTPSRGLLLSSSYAAGLSSAFGLAGAAAAWSGGNLQFALHTPATAGALAAVFAALAASMFGLFEISLPAGWTSWMSKRGKNPAGPGGAAIVGFTSALVVGPCVTAPLAGALLYVMQSGDVALGTSALFALGVGKCLPLVAIGTVGSGVLPRSGAWMEHVKKLFGFAFLLAAVWMADPVLPPGASLGLYGAVLLALAVFLSGSAKDRKGTFAASAFAAAVVGACGAVLMFGGATGSTDPLRPFAGLAAGSHGLAFTEAADSAAVLSVLADESGKRPVLLYFTADWCVACTKVERTVLPDHGTALSLAGIRLVKADLSDYGAEKSELMKQMRVTGPPTMVFFGKDGSEAPGTRLVGDVTAAGIERSAAAAKLLP